VVLKDICGQALIDIRSGLQVSQALAKHPKYFNEVFTQTLRAGEASGQFSEVAARLADYQEMEVTRRGQITSALIYPAVLACAAVGVIAFLITFVIPRLSTVFEGLGTDLPWNTRILLDFSDFITSHWFSVLVAIIAVVFAVRAWFSTSAGALSRDRMLITSPIVGPVIRKATVSRFARVLSTLIFGGVPILDALEIAGLSASNRIFLKSARLVEEEVRAGRPVAEAMRDAGAFPPVLTHMVAVGEETGDLPKMLGRVADSLDFEVDTGMRRLVSFVEPLIILTMGVVVGFVVLSVLLPIYQSQNLVK
jgi:type II secretory pathway component PulF